MPLGASGTFLWDRTAGDTQRVAAPVGCLMWDGAALQQVCSM